MVRASPVTVLTDASGCAGRQPAVGNADLADGASDAQGRWIVVAGVGEPVVQELSATSYDTPDLRLAHAWITLRRRTGGTDAG